MGNLIDIPNISPDSIVLDESPSVKTESNSNFNTQNYLNLRLEEGETEKTVIFRPLPMDLKTGSPWVKVHVHNVKVPKEMVKDNQKPYKTYICLAKTEGIDNEKFGKKCPFCEINYQAYKESKETDDPTKKENLQSISVSNLSKEAVIMRGIERGKEDEGVKFWKFNIRPDKTDPYNQIVKLYNLRKDAAEKKGKTENILDIYEGRDLIITVGGEGTAAPTIVDDSDKSPLTTNEELLKKWIYDEKKWQEVFTCKPYEYLALVAQMKIPWYDKSKGMWVDKEEYDAEHLTAKSETDAEIKNAEKKLTEEAEKNANSAADNDFAASITVDDNGDLPF